MTKPIASSLQDLINRLFVATNAFDVDGALALFTPDCWIDDLSVGGRFEGLAGVRSYIEQFFVGYETVTQLLSLEMEDNGQVVACLDLHGYFGHEISAMRIFVNADGIITAIDANVV